MSDLKTRLKQTMEQVTDKVGKKKPNWHTLTINGKVVERYGDNCDICWQPAIVKKEQYITEGIPMIICTNCHNKRLELYKKANILKSILNSTSWDIYKGREILFDMIVNYDHSNSEDIEYVVEIDQKTFCEIYCRLYGCSGVGKCSD